MDRKHLLLGGMAVVFVLAACQPTTQDGDTGATPSGMPADTAMTDTTMRDTSAALDPAAGRTNVYAGASVELR